MPKRIVPRFAILATLLVVALVAFGVFEVLQHQSKPSTPSSLYCVLTEITGDITLQQSGSTTPTAAKLGMHLQAGDTIHTSANGVGLITFADGSSTQLEPNTDISFDEINVNSQNGSTSIHMKQLVGTTINRVAKLVNSSSSYEITTPSGSAAVRGTVFMVVVLPEGTTSATVGEGKVWLVAQGVTQVIGADQVSSITPGSPPSSPERAQSIYYDLGVTYSQALVATGGPGPYKWSISSGTLPAGLSFNAATGVISGAPTAIGSSALTLEVTDSTGDTAHEVLFITINPPPAVTTASLSPGLVGAAYSQALVASGGAVPYTWSITSGILPAGLSLDASTGIISGLPASTGTVSITFKVTDSAGGSASRAISITINSASKTIAG